jgi:hypothetical protein
VGRDELRLGVRDSRAEKVDVRVGAHPRLEQCGRCYSPKSQYLSPFRFTAG